MREPGRKLFVYDSLCRDPVDWSAIKRRKRSFFAGTKVTMQMSQAGDEAGDTLAVLKNVYQSFRTERASDHLSEDIVACIVPGGQGDSPINDALNTAWKSLKALGNKHIGPKSGSVRVSKEDFLAHVYTRGLWNRPLEYKLLFTFQANPTDQTTRKRMRYLKDNERVGDTFFNEWPVPMYQPSQMPKVTPAEHEKMFALDTAIDDGADDGAGAAMIQDLGDNVVPYPREIHVKLWHEMIHVWGIEAAVLFWPGSGQSLLAFILERKRAVAVVSNAQQRTFLKQNVAQAVKTLGLAPDRRPPKPAELVAWESRRAVGGAPPKAGSPAIAGAHAPNALPAPAPAGAGAGAGGAGAPNIITAGTPAPRPPAPSPPPAAVPPAPAAQPATAAAAPFAAFGSSALR